MQRPPGVSEFPMVRICGVKDLWCSFPRRLPKRRRGCPPPSQGHPAFFSSGGEYSEGQEMPVQSERFRAWGRPGRCSHFSGRILAETFTTPRHEGLCLVQGRNQDCMVRLHALTPPWVERRCRRNPAGPTRVNVHLDICSSTPWGPRWREAPPCDPVYTLHHYSYEIVGAKESEVCRAPPNQVSTL
jgi:hypothetical protein